MACYRQLMHGTIRGRLSRRGIHAKPRNANNGSALRSERSYRGELDSTGPERRQLPGEPKCNGCSSSFAFLDETPTVICWKRGSGRWLLAILTAFGRHDLRVQDSDAVLAFCLAHAFDTCAQLWALIASLGSALNILGSLAQSGMHAVQRERRKEGGSQILGRRHSFSSALRQDSQRLANASVLHRNRHIAGGFLVCVPSRTPGSRPARGNWQGFSTRARCRRLFLDTDTSWTREDLTKKRVNHIIAALLLVEEGKSKRSDQQAHAQFTAVRVYG